jgi:alpha-L-fucosidase
MKGQLRELLTNYGPIGVLWFDGQWEGTWNHERAADLYVYVRDLQPSIIVNNRIDKGGSAHGMNRFSEFVGDFGTPEQEVLAAAPGADWEACLTMNDHWGYNAADANFKSTTELIRKLVDAASKGGNFLLNVGPTADGEIPAPELDRLAAIGRWMEVNGESIYGARAGPFPALKWGRCTQRPLPDGRTRLYLHVFDWPADGRLVVPGLYNAVEHARVLGTDGAEVRAESRDSQVVLALPPAAPDAADRVVVLDIRGEPDVALPPVISAPAPLFVDRTTVTLSTPRHSVELRYTLDGSDPGAAAPVFRGPIVLDRSATVSARAFRAGEAVGPVARATFRRTEPTPPAAVAGTLPGLRYDYDEGDWKQVPDFAAMTPRARGVAHDLSRSERLREDHFGFRYRGYIDVPEEGAYTFFLVSDDGSRMWLDGRPLIDNDGLHSLDEKSGVAALARGLHPITIEFFESSGGHELELWWESAAMKRCRVPDAAFRCDPAVP